MPAAAAPLSGRTISNDQSLQRNNSETGNGYEFRPVHEFKFSNMLKFFFSGLFEGDTNSAKLGTECLDVASLWIQGKSCVGIVSI